MINLSTKADTLKKLEGNLETCQVLPQVNFTVEELINSTDKVRKLINDKFAERKVIVRSSAMSEDSETNSMAGKFLSIPNVSGCDQIINASFEVAKSYQEKRLDNKILIQPMIENVKLSGVVFTLEPNTGSHYYVINYDNSSGSTDSVTSGKGLNLNTYYQFHEADCTDDQLTGLIKSAKELIYIFGKQNLDIEFAVDNKNIIFILQVRPLIIARPSKLNKESKKLKEIHNFIMNGMTRKPFIHGDTTMYGIMPDWNPAEIIGTRPKPLSLSLYRHLITDVIWAKQRRNYGYKNLSGNPLMIDMGGLPYIDVRVSFNSFIPNSINDELSCKLVNFYLNALKEQPESHDKVEFEIVFSCFTFDIDIKLRKLKNHFADKEIFELKQNLLDITNKIIDIDNGYWVEDLEKLKNLEERRNKILQSNLNLQSKIYWLLEDCINYGTLPFAGLARTGFIAISLLKSLVNLNILSLDEYETFFNSLSTVSSTFTKDINKLSKEQFLLKYGHLRPGTYDITIKRYDRAPDSYFGKERLSNNVKDIEKILKITEEKSVIIYNLMKKYGINGDVDSLFKFIKLGIEGREFSKFVFSKNISEALELISLLGENNGFIVQDMSYIDINTIIKLYSSADNLKKKIKESIKIGKQKYEESVSLNMPPLITHPNDIYSFHIPTNLPNFITLKSVTGLITYELKKCSDIKGKIILLKAADPGYDWIFTCGILGFVTAYGGVNSHMAIRASELGIPAVIGVGEKVYTNLLSAEMLMLDCANKKLEVVK